ncbi:ribonuclease P protein component [Metamycoplasma subdolum]|uniref:Ribonuclease P protein component n=1 Tax=Metamycoplasma subdolum TaxID=92407 RepID=A0A3M0A2F4_9BACT|nr:ribonuclease P protein component [Metamycoplasma subdolum]RMA79010.1 ribonuclease P protein component [Metamycoplasma subdolum]WPB50533.1 ribonuclease P protein component [Metamycoplasma subdolum]
MTEKNILKKNHDFQRIINSNSQIVTKNLIIYFLPSDFFKVGISIPKQFANAVLRNHYKNQIRTILRQMNIDNINFESVIIARKTFLSLSFENKEKEIRKIYERIVNGESK